MLAIIAIVISSCFSEGKTPENNTDLTWTNILVKGLSRNQSLNASGTDAIPYTIGVAQKPILVSKSHMCGKSTIKTLKMTRSVERPTVNKNKSISSTTMNKMLHERDVAGMKNMRKKSTRFNMKVK